MKTKIYYNIEETEYIFQTENFIFYFSSLFYLQKFIEKYKENREEIQYKLSSRYNIEFDSIDYCDFILYSKIEKRGFKIVCKNSEVVFKCLKNLKLNGEIRTLKN